MTHVAPLEIRHRSAWEALVGSCPSSGFMQSWRWSEFKALEGYTVTRMGLFDEDALAGGVIAYTFPTPSPTPSGAGLAVCPDGPVLDWESPEAASHLQALVRALRSAAAGRRIVAVRLEPRLERLPASLSDLPRGPVDLVPDETLLVPLGPEAAMLAEMKPKGRYNVRLAARRGVEVTSSTDAADVHEFFRVLEQTARYQDFRLEPKRFFINCVQALFPDLGRFAFARYRGMTLAAALTVRHGPTVTFLYGGHLPLFPQVMASYALHWHLLREASRDGYRSYDFYGYVAPGRAGHPYDRFSRFKERLGGRPVRWIGSRDVVFHDRLAEAALRTIRSMPAEALGAATSPPAQPGRGGPS
jgi:lipid II:glycine glycyltransferase (peptidoglycan interpeptide bridge formation enzyme)